MLDVNRLRADFPILNRRVHGHRLVYLDNAATTQRPQRVLNAMTEYYATSNSNVHRGVHTLAEESTAQYEGARLRAAEFLGVPEGDRAQVIFTRNATEAINLVAHAWARKHLRAGDEILLSVMEHHANLVPWFLLREQAGVVLRFLDIDEAGRLRLEGLDTLLTGRTKLVALTHASNVLGTIIPVEEIARRAHAAGALMLVDGAQGAPHLPVDLAALDADFYACSGHKMLGPTGVGLLYVRRRVLETMDPFLGGGEMISTVTLDGATWAELPQKFEAGTPNIGGAIATGAALGYLRGLGMEEVRAHERELADYALDRLGELDGVTVYGPRDPAQRTGAISFNLDRIHPHDVGTVLDGAGIAVRAGHHCAQPLMRRLGVAATVRASAYLYNDRSDIDALVEGLRRVQAFFGREPRGLNAGLPARGRAQ